MNFLVMMAVILFDIFREKHMYVYDSLLLRTSRDNKNAWHQIYL